MPCKIRGERKIKEGKIKDKFDKFVSSDNLGVLWGYTILDWAYYIWIFNHYEKQGCKFSRHHPNRHKNYGWYRGEKKKKVI